MSARPPGARAGAVEIDGTHLYYEQAGQSSDVVLVHGSMLDRRMWDDQFVSLAESFRVLRYDLRGYGRSPCGDAEFTHRDDLAELLERQLGRAMHLFLDFEPMRTAASVPALRARLEEMVGEHTWPLHQEGVPRPRPLTPPAAGAGHMVNMERPEEFERAMRDFLGRVGDRAV